MSVHIHEAHLRLVSRFRRKYLLTLEKHSIPVKARSWYEIYVEGYINCYQGVKLHRRLPGILLTN
jgi:hypothetical protein